MILFDTSTTLPTAPFDRLPIDADHQALLTLFIPNKKNHA